MYTNEEQLSKIKALRACSMNTFNRMWSNIFAKIVKNEAGSSNRSSSGRFAENIGIISGKTPSAAFLTKICNSITRQQIELESCSNPPQTRQVFQFRSKKTFFCFGFGVLFEWRHNGACFRLFGQVYLAPGVNPKNQCFGSRRSWKLGYYPRL